MAKVADRLPETLIVCAYSAQVEEVTRHLAESGLATGNVRVSTVDVVQGGGAAMVFLLFTRSFGDTSHVLDEHRLNVALSRAKETIVVFGSLEFLAPRGDGPIGRLLAIGKALGTVELVAPPPPPTKGDFDRDLVAKMLPQRWQGRKAAGS